MNNFIGANLATKNTRHLNKSKFDKTINFKEKYH